MVIETVKMDGVAKKYIVMSGKPVIPASRVS
jgi:hypothetical protein